MINDTAQPRDYAALYDASRAPFPDALITDATLVASQLCEGVEEMAKVRGLRSGFGMMSAFETAHKLAWWICQLSPYDYGRVKAWLEKEKP